MGTSVRKLNASIVFEDTYKMLKYFKLIRKPLFYFIQKLMFVAQRRNLILNSKLKSYNVLSLINIDCETLFITVNFLFLCFWYNICRCRLWPRIYPNGKLLCQYLHRDCHTLRHSFEVLMSHNVLMHKLGRVIHENNYLYMQCVLEYFNYIDSKMNGKIDFRCQAINAGQFNNTTPAIQFLLRVMIYIC
jgi:hypothetical protein